MSLPKYLKVAGLSIAGFALVFIGLYMIAFANAGPIGFGLMMGGLLLSTIGGIYGKKKLLEQIPETSRQMEQIKENVVSQLKPQKEADPPQEISRPDEPPEQKPLPKQAANAEPKPETELKPIIRTVQVQAEGALKPKLVKVMVCPGCDTENPPTNMYCSKCGKRLRAQQLEKPRKRRKKATKKKAKGKK